MRYGLLGDIHGNLEALTAILDAFDKLPTPIDALVCLGDIVGYGANPEECLAMIRERGALIVAGNHDHAAIGKLDIAYFNQFARKAAIWTQEHLSAESKEFLSNLPFVIHTEHFAAVHGSLQSPEQFNYVQTLRDAEYNFSAMDKSLLLLGHSHQPLAFFDTHPMTYTLDPIIPLETDIKTIVNIGSVGQPRDEDPRACAAMYDSQINEVSLIRVDYDIEIASGKIADAGLPEALALRLALGK